VRTPAQCQCQYTVACGLRRINRFRHSGTQGGQRFNLSGIPAIVAAIAVWSGLLMLTVFWLRAHYQGVSA
jgi:hypothetical protein